MAMSRRGCAGPGWRPPGPARRHACSPPACSPVPARPSCAPGDQRARSTPWPGTRRGPRHRRRHPAGTPWSAVRPATRRHSSVYLRPTDRTRASAQGYPCPPDARFDPRPDRLINTFGYRAVDRPCSRERHRHDPQVGGSGSLRANWPPGMPNPAMTWGHGRVEGDLLAAAEERASETFERREQHHSGTPVGARRRGADPAGRQLPYEADRFRHIHLRERRCAQHGEMTVEPSARRTCAALHRGNPRPAAHMLNLIHIPPLGRHQGRGAKTIRPERSACNCSVQQHTVLRPSDIRASRSPEGRAGRSFTPSSPVRGHAGATAR